MIKRDSYLNELIGSMHNGMIKIITGIRRCGKSYLLDPIFRNYLLERGISEDHIIKIDLDERKNKKYLDPDYLDEFVRTQIKDDSMYYLLLDEVQMVDDFESVLNGFLHIKNIDVYVTGSNSKFLSSDIITEFRGRGDQIKVFPLSFKEFYEARGLPELSAWNEYLLYGGMPQILSFNNPEQKAEYLKQLFDLTYVSDIVQRHNFKRRDLLDSLINIVSSSVGSLTNTQKIFDTFKSKGESELSKATLDKYVEALEDSFLVNKAMRYDIKGRKYISTPYKYYFADVGLRNAKLNFRQHEESHLMENVIFNELLIRGFNVDVGEVSIRTAQSKIYTEVDFVCNLGYRRYYIQSAYSLYSTDEKMDTELRPLRNIDDSFTKIIITHDSTLPYRNDDGVLIINILDFLLDPDSLKKY